MSCPLFIIVVLHINNQRLKIDNVLVDTGSSACIFDTLDILSLGEDFDGTKRVRTMSGIGGDEYVLEKEIQSIEIDSVSSGKWLIQVGDIQYGFGIKGVIGSDLLSSMGALIDYRNKSLVIQFVN